MPSPRQVQAGGCQSESSTHGPGIPLFNRVLLACPPLLLRILMLKWFDLSIQILPADGGMITASLAGNLLLVLNRNHCSLTEVQQYCTVSEFICYIGSLWTGTGGRGGGGRGWSCAGWVFGGRFFGGVLVVGVVGLRVA